jgi:serine/threonine protein kinase
MNHGGNLRILHSYRANDRLSCICAQIRDLHHDNLNAFIGACVDPGNICIITEYCTKGSLQDILANDDVKLDNMFVSSLVSDLIRVSCIR